MISMMDEIFLHMKKLRLPFVSILVEQVVCCKMTPLQVEIYKAFLNSKALKLQMAANKTSKMSASSLAFITQIKKLCNREYCMFMMPVANGIGHYESMNKSRNEETCICMYV